MNPMTAANVAAKSPTGFTLDSNVIASDENDSDTVKITTAKIMAELITKVFFCILLQPPLVHPFPLRIVVCCLT
jgi:hypothetical protein